ncbi:MAG TPA: hypothetical protein VMN99_10570 [Anaerolineales bacterium]|nr:hypothetical protein [Anaerolineales bacterium]
MWDKIRSYLEFLLIRGKDIRFLVSSPYRIGLIVLFTVLFFPHVFVMVEDISLVRAYEVDPGSIVDTIVSLYQPSDFYNMNVPYHSKFYGWTYYWISFLLAAPAYILTSLNVFEGYAFFLVSVRFILFLISLAFALAFFEVARRLFKQELLAFVACLLCLASPAVSNFFYFIHPETTGLLFLFLALLCLLNFHESLARGLRWYTFGLLCLTLSVLSKHVFLFTALPVLFLFLYVYCHHHQITLFRFILSRKFVLVLFGSLVFSGVIFFIINPFAFFQPRIFFANQLRLFSTQTQGSSAEMDAVKAWLEILWTMPAIYISILLAPLSFFGAIRLRDQKVGLTFYLVNLAGSLFFLFFTVMSLRYLIYAGYLAPIYPLFILNLLGTAVFVVRRLNLRSLKLGVGSIIALCLLFILIKDFSISLPVQWNRLTYQDSLAYQSYQYIEAEIPAGTKIAHDQFVAVPYDTDIVGCHYWAGGCGSDYIEKFQPDYVIFNDDWTFQGATVPQKTRLITYINDYDFVLIDTIGNPAYPGSSLQVWQKP